MPKVKAGTRDASGKRFLLKGVDPLGMNEFWNKNPQRRKTYSKKGSKEIDVAYLPKGGDWDRWL